MSWLSRIFGVGLRTQTHLLPRLPGFLIKAPFPLTLVSPLLAFEWQAAKSDFGNNKSTYHIYQTKNFHLKGLF